MPLQDDRADVIKWNIPTNGTYPSASANKAQFEGTVETNMGKVVWGELGASQVQVVYVACYLGYGLDG